MSLALVDFTDEQNGFLIDAHPVFVWTKQLLHVILCTTETFSMISLFLDASNAAVLQNPTCGGADLLVRAAL